MDALEAETEFFGAYSVIGKGLEKGWDVGGYINKANRAIEVIERTDPDLAQRYRNLLSAMINVPRAQKAIAYNSTSARVGRRFKARIGWFIAFFGIIFLFGGDPLIGIAVLIVGLFLVFA